MSWNNLLNAVSVVESLSSIKADQVSSSFSLPNNKHLQQIFVSIVLFIQAGTFGYGGLSCEFGAQTRIKCLIDDEHLKNNDIITVRWLLIVKIRRDFEFRLILMPTPTIKKKLYHKYI